MDRVLSIFNFKRWPWGFLTALAVVYGLQFTLVHSPAFWKLVEDYYEPLSEDYLRIDGILRMMPDQTEDKRVFIIGSSQALQDLDERHYNRVFAGEDYVFYNLGSAGTAQPIDLYMAEDRLLAKHPDTIIYMPFIESFYQHYQDHGDNILKHYYQEKILPQLWSKLDFTEFSRFRNDIFDAYISRLSFFYKYRNELFLLGKRVARSVITGEKPRSWDIPLETRKGPEHFEEMIARYPGKSRYCNSTELSRDLFIRFASRLRDEGVNLVVVSGPMHPQMPQLYADPAIAIDFDDFLKDQSEELGFVYIPVSQQPNYTDEDFLDFTHLSREGREKMTRFFTRRFAEDVIGEPYSSAVAMSDDAVSLQ